MCAERRVPRVGAPRDPSLLPVRDVWVLRDAPSGDGLQPLLRGGHVLHTVIGHHLRVLPHLMCHCQQIQ